MNDIDKAIQLLQAGDVVAIPTETVYGLAASITSEKGLQKIFSIKERPFFDPLIVHVSDVEMAKTLCLNWGETCEALAGAFWPGPLTIVVKKNNKVSDLITSGLDSVGLRCPSHPIAMELIRKLGSPVAAPSANKFKRTSPTKSSHVVDEFGDEVYVLEGGDSQVGIESTVAAVFEDRVEIYRPGMLTVDDIQRALQRKGLVLPVSLAQSPVAPGQLKHHYMPKIPVGLCWDNSAPNLSGTVLNDLHADEIAAWNIGAEAAEQVARKLYSYFRDAEINGKKGILISLPATLKKESVWAGVLNRLDKAKSFEVF